MSYQLTRADLDTITKRAPGRNRILDVDGQIIDPTWPDGGHYFGVVLDEEFVREMIVLTKHFGAFGSAYRLKESADETRDRFDQAVLKAIGAMDDGIGTCKS